MGDELHHFTYGAITPAFAYAMSFLGSLLGLVSTARARAATDSRRRAWLLVLAAWSIGGTGIWVMHFMAMIGFSVTGSPLRYDIPTTVASFFIAVVTVGIGLFIVGLGKPSALKVLIGGPITGVSVAFMHYTGMAAMQLHLANDLRTVPGVDVNWFLAPIVLFVLVVVIALASAVMAVPSEREQAEEDAVHEKLSAGHAMRTDASAGPVFGGGSNGRVNGRVHGIGEPPPAPQTGPGGGRAGPAFAARAANGIADARRQRGGR